MLKDRIVRRLSSTSGGRAFGAAVVALVAIGLGTLPVSAASSPATSSASSSRSQVAPAPRIPRDASALGAVPASATIQGAVMLQPRDARALQQYLGMLNHKGSSQYHKYIGAGQFATRFGPSQSTINAVVTHLKANGLRVTSVARDGMLVSFSGPAADAGKAFGTSLAAYRLSDGTTGRGTTGAVSLPSAIAHSVAAVVGLNDLVHQQHAKVLRPPASAAGHIAAPTRGTVPLVPGAPVPCGDAANAAFFFGGLTDDQIANAYGAYNLYGAGDFGQNQNVAIYELEPFAQSDLAAFDNCYFPGEGDAMAATVVSNIVPVDGGQPAGPGSAEAALDVEDVSAMAPQATIHVYEAPNNTFGALDEYAQIVNDDTSTIVTSSWGLCEQAVQLAEPGIQQAENLIFEQAAAQGQTVLNASGDTGMDTCNAFRYTAPVAGQNPVSVGDPGSQPYVMAVGGTTLDDAVPGSIGEHVWNDGAAWGAGGGGISNSWQQPSWQSQLIGSNATVSTNNASAVSAAQTVESQFGYPTGFCSSSGPVSCRELPDVSAQADEFTGAITMYMGQFGGWFTIGGTSSAAPLWAGLLALVNDSQGCGGAPVGFVPPLLYAIASNPFLYGISFHDITAGNNDIYGLANGQVFNSGTNYDMASGLGSPMLTAPNGSSGLADALCFMAATGIGPRPVVDSLSPASGPATGGFQVTINGSNFMPSGSAQVASIEVGTMKLSSSEFTVLSDSQIVADFPNAASTVAPGSPAPLDGAGPAPVIVTMQNGESSNTGAASTFQYVDTGTVFSHVSGTGHDVAAGSSVFVLGTDSQPGGFGIWKRTGSSWTRYAGGATSIAVDPAGNPWVTNSSDQIYHWNGASWDHMPGQAVYVAAGEDGSVYVLGTGSAPGGQQVWKWVSGAWASVPGGLTDLSVGRDGSVWGANNTRQIWHMAAGGSWSQVPGQALDTAATDYNDAVVVGTTAVPGGDGLWAWHGSGWSSLPGGATDIAFDNSNASIWAINSALNIYQSGNPSIPSVTSVGPYGGSETTPTPVHVYGSGFTGATGVSFGGVFGTGLDVINDSQIIVTPPVYSGSVACAPSLPGMTPTTDICQTQVRVVNANGKSATSPILKPYEGATLPLTTMGVPQPPAGYELVAAPTEFDYVPTPTITSVSTDPANILTYANEVGPTFLDVHGRGFNPQTFTGTAFGDPTIAFDQGYFPVYQTGTEIQLWAPPPLALVQSPTFDPTTAPMTVTTLGGTSAGADITYAGIPRVDTVVNSTSGAKNLGGTYGGPDTGGSPLTIDGIGYSDVWAVGFFDAVGFYSFGTQYNFAVTSDTEMTTQTVQQNPGEVLVDPCSVSACADYWIYSQPYPPPPPTATQVFVLYPPGDPHIDSVGPNYGPQAGGTDVVISGENLGCAISASFGSQTVSAGNFPGFLDCGTTGIVSAITPAQAAAGPVPVTVETAESYYEGTSSNSDVTFDYIAPPTVTSVNPNAGTIAGGTSVTIAGTGFFGGAAACDISAVDFGANAADLTTITACSDTSVTLSSPPGIAGTVDVTVTTNSGGGPSATSANDQFTYS